MPADASDDDLLSIPGAPWLDSLPRDTLFAVRSSGLAEDSADDSFAGIHDTELNVSRDRLAFNAQAEARAGSNLDRMAGNQQHPGSTQVDDLHRDRRGQGKLAGIITDGDLRRHMRPDLLERRVEDIMTKRPITAKADQLASEVLEVMNSANGGKGITALFVVDAGKPVGLVHMQDLLRIGVA